MLSRRLSRLDVEKEEGTDAYLITKLKGNHKQKDLLNEKVQQVPKRARSAYRHFVIHLLNCAWRSWAFVGVGFWFGYHLVSG